METKVMSQLYAPHYIQSPYALQVQFQYTSLCHVSRCVIDQRLRSLHYVCGRSVKVASGNAAFIQFASRGKRQPHVLLGTFMDMWSCIVLPNRWTQTLDDHENSIFSHTRQLLVCWHKQTRRAFLMIHTQTCGRTPRIDVLDKPGILAMHAP